MRPVPTPTPAQRLAIGAGPGPLLVIAGPGAGKTFCLIERTYFLINTLGLDPERILTVTFTNKAAAEVRTRLRGRLGDAADRITGGTLHALCARILRERGQSVGVDPGFGIADDAYQKEILTRLRVPRRRHGQLLNLFGQARFQSRVLTQGDEKLFSQYEAVLHERRLLDFDQLVAKTAELFRRYPVAAEEVADQWDAILVDEFQDLDRKQYAVIKALADGHRNIFVVGDDEQSIFSWRGAEPAVLGLFQKDFRVAEPIVLDRNLRCAKPIFAAARRLVEGNPALFAKRIEAERESRFEVTAVAFEDELAEAAWIVDDIRRDREEHQMPLGDIAVLFRQHAHANPLEEALLKAAIPCRFARGRSMRDDPVIGYLLGALRLALDPDDPALLALFAERHLPKAFRNRVRARVPDGEILAQLRTFAETQPRDNDTRRAWRFIFLVENLATAARAHTRLDALVGELLTLRIGRWENRLEREAYRLLDPLEDDAAVRLAERIASAEGAGERIVVPGADPHAVAMRSLLGRAHVRRVTAESVGGLVIDQPAVTVFRAMQLSETRHLGQAFERYVTFDAETTGVDVASCEVVELGAARVVGGTVVETFQRLVRPTVPIEHQAARVHGISDAMVADAEPFAAAWSAFQAFVGDDVLVAHNAHDFDVPVLRRLAGADGLRAFDTLPLARAVVDGNASLQKLAARFGVETGQSHRALDDAVTLAGVFPHLERLRIARARKSALVNLLDDVALALAFEDGDRTDQAALLFDLGRFQALGARSRCLEPFAGTDVWDDAVRRLGGRELWERLQRERSADDLYPEAMERLRPFLDAPGTTVQDQIRSFLETTALSGSAEGDVERHAVNLLTLHATKGLEFSRVYIVGVEDGTLPGYRAVREKTRSEIEEGRRLLYVGMTRARDRLVLTRADQRGGHPGGASMYLEEMGLPHPVPASDTPR